MESFKNLFPSCCCAPQIEQTKPIFRMKNEEMRNQSDSDQSDEEPLPRAPKQVQKTKNVLYSIEVFPKNQDKKEEESKKEIDSKSISSSGHNPSLLELRRRVGSYTMETVYILGEGKIKGVNEKTKIFNEGAFFGIPLKGNRSKLEEFVKNKEEMEKPFFEVKKNEDMGFSLEVCGNEVFVFFQLTHSVELSEEPIKISFSKSAVDVKGTKEGILSIWLDGKKEFVYKKEETREVTLGRNKENMIVVPDEFASKRQMSFVFKGNKWKVKDGFKEVRSTNGNWIKVLNKCNLESGMNIRCGRNFFDVGLLNNET